LNSVESSYQSNLHGVISEHYYFNKAHRESLEVLSLVELESSSPNKQKCRKVTFLH